MRAFIWILSIPVFIYAYSLEELIDLSHKNRLVESAVHINVSKQKAYDSTKSSYLPSIALGASYQNAYEETVALAQDSLKVQADIKYTIYDGGKKDALLSMLKSNVNSSKQDIKALKDSISLEVVRLYFEYMSLDSDKKAMDQQIDQLKAEVKRLDFFYRSGSVTKDELDKVDSRLKSALVSLQENELRSQRVLYTLEYYTKKKIDVIEKGAFIKLKDTNDKALTRADIESMKLNVDSVLYEADSEKSQNLPSIIFSDTISHSDYYFDDKPISSFLVETQNIAALNLTWNIFDFGAVDKSYESKYEEYLSKKAVFEHEKHKADVEHRFAKKALEIAKQKIDSAKAAFEAADSTYRLVKFKYENKTVDNVAFLEALSEKYDAQRDYERALWDLEIKKAELLYYGGRDIKEFL